MTSSNALENGVAYVNGSIYTVNLDQPWIEAFIVGSDGYIKAVGSNKDIGSQAKELHLTVYDLRGLFTMPGIHDAHVHIFTSAMANTSQIRLPQEGVDGSNVAEELKKGGCMCKYAHANQDWVIGHTYRIEDYDRSMLDREYPDTPVILRGGAGHAAFLNTEALKRSGYDIESEPDGQATVLIRDASGHLTGEVAENGMTKFTKALPQPNLAHVKRCIRDGVRSLHEVGVTSCQEASANTAMLHAFRELDKEGNLKLDVHTHIVYAPEWVAEESSETLHKSIDEAGAFRSKHVDTRFVKIILDGAPLPPYFSHAALKDDGEIDPSNLLTLNIHNAVREYDSRGMTVKMHATGHGSTRTALDAIEAARKNNPGGPRHEVAHCNGVHEDDYPRFKDLNVTAEMSPAFFFVHPITQASGGLMDWNFPKMLAANAHNTIGSDWGAIPTPELLPHLASVIKSVANDDTALWGQRFVRMLTLAGAEAVGREKELGSIEVGKKANFISLDKDLSQGELEGANVVTTWFEGEIVYERV